MVNNAATATAPPWVDGPVVPGGGGEGGQDRGQGRHPSQPDTTNTLLCTEYSTVISGPGVPWRCVAAHP